MTVTWELPEPKSLLATAATSDATVPGADTGTVKVLLQAPEPCALTARIR